MSTFIDYIILPKEKLVIEYFSGNVGLKDVITFKRRLMQDPDYRSEFNIIDDLRDAQFVINKSEVKGYVDFILKNEGNLGQRNTAFITSNPNQVVISTLFESLKANLPINTEVVSTIEMAINHVRLSIFLKTTIQECIKRLKERRRQ